MAAENKQTTAGSSYNSYGFNEAAAHGRGKLLASGAGRPARPPLQ